MGKLNIWQWLGVVLLIVWAVLYFNRKSDEKERAKQPATPGTPVTQPAPLPATNPG
ncbi:Sec-independent protein translocase family protein [Humisphaera borealis]|uniref:Uncharacterized protein n=1 Tax=Humisphaera borealis TaxID=2807512 RepID=A0A7M2WRD3_9BACT|nr:hypothetical protein [Humisphaera borealis]QOV87983.1 hypothetical protein IPV69_17135 [Humisphaera borealis]